jgi:hypothetical protein
LTKDSEIKERSQSPVKATKLALSVAKTMETGVHTNSEREIETENAQWRRQVEELALGGTSGLRGVETGVGDGNTRFETCYREWEHHWETTPDRWWPRQLETGNRHAKLKNQASGRQARKAPQKWRLRSRLENGNGPKPVRQSGKMRAYITASHGAEAGKIRHEYKKNHEAQTGTGTRGLNSKMKIPQQVTKAKIANKIAQQRICPDLSHPRRKTRTTQDKM